MVVLGCLLFLLAFVNYHIGHKYDRPQHRFGMIAGAVIAIIAFYLTEVAIT